MQNNKVLRIKELVSLLNKAREEYYQNSNEIMSNKKYDQLFDELSKLEQETGFILNNSPTVTVGYEVKESLTKVTHPEPMLSLDKTKNVNELKDFLGNKQGVLSWKLDGLTVVLTYDKGKLVQAVTRGNGIVGTDVLHIMKQVKNVPKYINYKGKLIVRGECLISYSDFKVINVDNKYQNCRNLASGTIISLDSKIVRERNLQWFAFNLVQAKNVDFNNSFDMQMQWLQSQGFDTVDYKIVDRDNLETTVKWFENNIQNYDLPFDGLVLVFNNLKYRDSLGSTSHHPLGWYAFKWQDETKETILRDVVFQVGRTGVLTPVAIFDSVRLDGTNVGRANIHNLSKLKELELGISDVITVYKSNMISPQVDDNLTRSNTLKIPDKCPICGHNLEIVISDNAEFLYCKNPNCKAQLIQKISHYCSRNAMDITGLSEKTIEKFIKKGFLNKLSDLYKIQEYKSTICKMQGFGVKSYNNLINSIKKSKKCKLANFIFALGIPNVGLQTAKDICKYFNDDLKAIRKADINKLLKVKDIGEKTAQSIYDYFINIENIELLEELLQYVEFIKDNNKAISTDGVFKGMKIYCTGSFTCGKKNNLKEMVENNGGTFANGYSKKLDLLIVGSLKGSSKSEKAKKDGIKVIGEEEFVKMIKK